MSNAAHLEITRALVSDCEVRAIDEENRTATFVAATENGVMTRGGTEYLRMSGVQLQRYKKNPVVLDAHNRWSVGAVIGRAQVRREGRLLMADIEFAGTERAENVWQLVRDGFVRTVSVGFMPDQDNTIYLDDDDTDGEGESAIRGPGVLIKRWELFEISVVPVPADADAVRRSYLADDPEAASAVLASAMRNLTQLWTEETDEQENDDMAGEEKQEAQPVEDPQAQPEKRAEEVMAQPETPQRDFAAEANEIRGYAAGLGDEMERCAAGLAQLKATPEQARTTLLQLWADRRSYVGNPPADATCAEERAEAQAEELDEKQDFWQRAMALAKAENISHGAAISRLAHEDEDAWREWVAAQRR
jgi:hypothetical protein